MKTQIMLLSAALALDGGCASHRGPQAWPGAAKVGAPSAEVDAALLTTVSQPEARGAGTGPIRLPDRIALPATYRLLLLDGHLELVRETDPQMLLQAPATMRVVAGEIARGELAYQPGLLPQELAAEVAANRESSARMDNALEDVMRRSRELSEQAMELQAQSRKLAELLSAAQTRIRDLEAQGRAPQVRGRQEPANPHDQDTN
jgi:hypothetical protein